MKTSVAFAPSNIALVKYMGKEDSRLNLPLNGSLSLTLNQLCTVVEIQSSASGNQQSTWIPEPPRIPSPDLEASGLRAQVPSLSEAGTSRVLKHVERVRDRVQSLFSPYG